MKQLIFATAILGLVAIPVSESLASCFNRDHSDIQNLKSCQKAAEAGDAEAQFYLGKIYWQSKEIGNIDEAEKWLTKSAAQGDAYAKIALKKINRYKAENTPEAIRNQKEQAAKEQAILDTLPQCNSDFALTKLKEMLGDRLLDYDKDTFCENFAKEGTRQCIGHFTVADAGEIRLTYSFKQKKSDPESFLVEVVERGSLDKEVNIKQGFGVQLPCDAKK